MNPRFFLEKLMRRYRNREERKAEQRMRLRHGDVWTAVTGYHRDLGAGSLRKNWIKYETLYRLIRSRKPEEILELGAGTSTVVIAHALMDNDRESGDHSRAPRVTSLEEREKYHSRTTGAFPGHLRKYADILLRPKTEGYYQLFRGVRYADVPMRPYEFVFVDGPTTGAPSDGQKTFDFDFLDVVSRSERPVSAVVDLRLSGLWAYEHVFGRGKVMLDRRCALGFVGPVTKKDMRTTNEIVARHSFRGARSPLW